MNILGIIFIELLVVSVSVNAQDKSTIREYKKMNVKISSNIPAGNIKVISVSGNKIILDADQRDNHSPWFYWCFKALFSEKGKYFFHFASPNMVGTQGPALSIDNGISWNWLGKQQRLPGQDFEFDCDGKSQEVIFCVGMQYLEGDFVRFREEFAGNPHLKVSELCRTRKGRSVEFITICEGNPQYRLLLTSRHHACEMMATHALEGILRTVLADDKFGDDFRKHVALYAVPFVDKDGVEDGDQGKNRRPHDHAREYYRKDPIYPETKEIISLVETLKPDFILDMHCPWIYGSTNEYIYIPGQSNPRMVQAMDVFGSILEKEAPPECPYFKKDSLLFGIAWNKEQDYDKAQPLKYWGGQHDFVSNCQTLEIPYANTRNIVLGKAAMHKFGRALAVSILKYLKQNVNK